MQLMKTFTVVPEVSAEMYAIKKTLRLFWQWIEIPVIIATLVFILSR
jgi:hypothetical protein